MCGCFHFALLLLPPLMTRNFQEFSSLVERWTNSLSKMYVCVPLRDGISFPPLASLSQPVFLPISPFASSLFALHLSSSFLTTQCSIATKALGWRHAVLYCGEHGRLILINVAETPLKKAPWLSSRNWQCFKSYPLHGRKH